VNDDEILAFAKLTLDRPVHIRFIEFMPVGTKNGWDKSIYISSSEMQEQIKQLGTLIPITSQADTGPAKMYRLDGAEGKLGFITALSSHFCETCNRLRLTADGKLRTCLFSDNEIDLKTSLRTGCSNSDLQLIINQAILAKPKQHKFAEPSFKKCFRGMSAIGG
jgi:GTP 3',8-cyclase